MSAARPKFANNGRSRTACPKTAALCARPLPPCSKNLHDWENTESDLPRESQGARDSSEQAEMLPERATEYEDAARGLGTHEQDKRRSTHAGGLGQRRYSPTTTQPCTSCPRRSKREGKFRQGRPHSSNCWHDKSDAQDAKRECNREDNQEIRSADDWGSRHCSALFRQPVHV